MKAAVAIKVRGNLSLDGFDDLVEQIRETAHPQPSGRIVLVTWEAETAWKLRGIVQETLDALESEFYGYVDLPDIEEPGDGTDTDLSHFQVWE